LNIIFAGTPAFAVPSLHALLQAGMNVVAVYSQPDRPAGRGKKIKPGPVKAAAIEANIPVQQPLNFKDPADIETLAAYQPDAMIVVAYGLILPEAVLQIPRLGCLNVHASLLPRWRGAAPIQRAIETGDKQTGITIMQMDKGLDTGNILATAEVPISPTENAGQLHDRLASVGGKLLVDTLQQLNAGQLQSTPQVNSLACYAKKLEKSEAIIDWRQPAEVISRKINAFNPWPMASTSWQNKRLRIWEAATCKHNDAKPGTILAANADGIQVATGEGCVNILQLQADGGKPMPVKDFLNGQKISVGDEFA